MLKPAHSTMHERSSDDLSLVNERRSRVGNRLRNPFFTHYHSAVNVRNSAQFAKAMQLVLLAVSFDIVYLCVFSSS